MIMFPAFETRTTHGQHAKTNSILIGNDRQNVEDTKRN